MAKGIGWFTAIGVLIFAVVVHIIAYTMRAGGAIDASSGFVQSLLVAAGFVVVAIGSAVVINILQSGKQVFIGSFVSVLTVLVVANLLRILLVLMIGTSAINIGTISIPI